MTRQMPILYGARYSVYTRIARMALVEKGVACDFRDFDVYNAAAVPPEYSKLNPFRKIPTLVDGDLTIIETSAITRYIDEAWEGPSLQPVSAVERAAMNQAISLMDSYGFPALVKGVYVERISKPGRGEKTDEELVAASLAIAGKLFTRLEKIRGKSNFLAGNSPTLADIHVYPVLRYFWLEADGRKLIGKFAGITGWMEDFSRRPSAKSTCPPAEDC